MRSLFSILLKNAILLALIVISVIFVLTNQIGFKEVRFLFLGMGILYVIAACFEAYQLSSIKKETPKFTYFTDGFLAKRFIKIIAFTCCGVVLYYSKSIAKYMAFLCFLIAFTEIIVTLWRFINRLCFVAFENDMLIISTNKLNTMKASQIAKIETRHGLTYFVNNANESFTLRTDMMKQNKDFAQALEHWIKTYQLSEKMFVD